MNGSEHRHRNRNFEETHRLLIETAGELIAESGADGVSISALARATGINRSTVYYHFNTRKALMTAALEWSEEQAGAAAGEVSRWVGSDQIAGFLRHNPDIITAWIENCIEVGDIRERYPQWDRLVSQVSDAFSELAADDHCDVEVCCALMLTSAFVVPQLCPSSVHPFASLERILERLHATVTEYANAA